MDNKKEIKKYIKEINNIIYGNKKTYGMIDCLDGYYTQVFMEQLNKLEKIKEELLKTIA